MDDNYFTLDRDWSLLSFLLYRQQFDDFSADKCKEHKRYVFNLSAIISNEDSSEIAIERASKSLKSMRVNPAFNHPHSRGCIEFCLGWFHPSGKYVSSCPTPFDFVRNEKKSYLVNIFWKGATSALKRRIEALCERSALVEELATYAVRSTLQRDIQGYLVRENVTRRLESIGKTKRLREENDEVESKCSYTNNTVEIMRRANQVLPGGQVTERKAKY
ncbi:4164_t:CDS:2 [Gigaspora rosea]|nr:4164_t:CDS:2 [Gigaspora rosea]